jgi:hypothetical protein
MRAAEGKDSVMDLSLNTENSNTTYNQPCTCGRSFSQPSALKYHQRSCSKAKKRLCGALVKAKEAWSDRKRRRVGDAGLDRGSMCPQESTSVSGCDVIVNDTSMVRASGVLVC